MRRCNYHPYINDYMDGIYSGEIIVSDEIILAMDLVQEKLDDPRVFIDSEKIYKAVELSERYFEIKLFDWELFIYALIHCYYDNDTVVFKEFDIMMGRGNGKNGFISTVAWYLTTHYHGIKEYNVDIIANSEEQALTSFMDVYNVLENTWTKSKKFFYKSKEIIRNLKTRSYIKFNTSNAKTKDGKRSACIIFDEIHEYENYSMINVFTSGFGKRKHSRIFKITTNGHVREGVLDKELRIWYDILRGNVKTSKRLPLIYKVNSEEEIQDKRMWHKPNPSLKYLTVLQDEMNEAFLDMEYDEEIKSDFYTKRMNWPRSNKEIAVTDYETNVIPTNRPLPDMTGWKCTVGIDYAAFNDFMSINYHFKKGDMRYDINHSWVCRKSADWNRIKPSLEEWEREGHITIVDEVTMHPSLLTEHISEMQKKYHIEKIALDYNKFALVSGELKGIGFDTKENKNLVLVRPNDIYRVEKVIDDALTRHWFTWGDNPPLRWAINNTKKIASGRKTGEETGNFYYGKIEAKSRKTDPFMALVHSMVVEDSIPENSSTFYDIPLITI